MDPLEELANASREAAQPQSHPLQYQSKRRVRRRRDSGNSMGTAGFILSLVGLFTCGVLSLVGLIFSIIGLKREPRGLALAGFIVGILSVLLWLIWFLIYGYVLLHGLSE
jgi:hypothetical protein